MLFGKTPRTKYRPRSSKGEHGSLIRTTKVRGWMKMEGMDLPANLRYSNRYPTKPSKATEGEHEVARMVRNKKTAEVKCWCQRSVIRITWEEVRACTTRSCGTYMCDILAAEELAASKRYATK